MIDPIESIFATLAADATLAALIDTHGGAVALFSGDVLPASYDLSAVPCVVVGPIEDQSDRDDFGAFYRQTDVRVRLYALAGESGLAIDTAADRVRAVLHRKTLAASGGATPTARVISGPAAANTSGPDVAGRAMTVRLLFKE